jgi:tripartite ATP-independent transporter DctM subunit
MSRAWQTIDNYDSISVPMFLLMGNFLAYSGIAEGLFESFRYLMGPIKGGLAVGVEIVSTVFAACVGVVAASIGTIGVLATPVMVKAKYDKYLLLGTIMSGGCLGILIPPSIMLVIMGSSAGISVGKLMAGALVPGLLLAVLYIVYIIVMCQIHPDWGPPISAEERARVTVPQRLKGAAVNLVPPIILIAGVLGSIFSGVATPTEAAGVGAFISFLMVLAYKKFSWKVMRSVAEQTARFVAMMLMLQVGANFFSATFTGLGGGDVVKAVVLITGSKWGAFIVMQLIYFVLGFFMDWFGIILITFPLFFPIVTNLGFDPIWFAVVIAVNLQSSFLTPPFGYALFYMVPLLPEGWTLKDLYVAVWPFVGIIAVALVLCIIWPPIIMWLPSLI